MSRVLANQNPEILHCKSTEEKILGQIKSSKNAISIDILNKEEGLLDNNCFNNFDHELKVIEN